jgi:surface polysaccharide O-acyltransferase-like enzyme
VLWILDNGLINTYIRFFINTYILYMVPPSSTTQEFYMKEISSIDFPQHGEVFYSYGKAIHYDLNLHTYPKQI